ncbi:MAG: flavodoxin family protein [Deltaproteobacteria bacterium CG03_land_8_20_14_0_80_45_14]|nr:MAG: flavodoxin family protein [Deltaproteobacteria bacterium CG03_land_8_20_14_0_80_45_14]
MKVLGIFGSPRRGGNTELLLEEALKGAEKEGAKGERLYLSDFTITPCKECHGCDNTGNCIILDDMEKIYSKLLEADIVILASPIFFYGVTAWAKALIDRSQALWARKYLIKDPSLGKEGKKRKGFLISVGATKGQKVFEGAILTVKYFFDVLNAEYAGELFFRGVEAKGDILKHPGALQQAFEAGRRLIYEDRIKVRSH